MTDPTVTLTRSVVVGAAPDRLFRLCEEAESLAPLLADVRSVERTGDGRHRWWAELEGSRLTWETVAVTVEPTRRIAWRVRPGRDRRRFAGEVQFQPRPTGATEVRLVLSCAGTPGLSVTDAARIVDDNLESFRTRAESHVAAAPGGVESRLDADRAASMADEGGVAAAETAGGTPPTKRG